MPLNNQERHELSSTAPKYLFIEDGTTHTFDFVEKKIKNTWEGGWGYIIREIFHTVQYLKNWLQNKIMYQYQ